MSDSLQSLVDRAAFLSAEVQQRFGALIAGRDFEVDFSAAPTLRFTGDEPVDFRPHMMGTSVDRQAERTWHWGWDNVNDFPEQVVALSARVRDHGSAHGITQLHEAELPSDPENLPLALTLASKAITGAWAHYPVAAGGSTTVWVLVDDERLALGQPELKPVVRAIASGISGLEVADHRTALASYAELRGLRTAPLVEGGVRILCADGSADVTFDEQERITSCQAHQPLEGEAAEQFARVGAVTGTAVFGEAAVGLPAPVEPSPAEAAPATSDRADAAPVEEAPAEAVPAEAAEAPVDAAQEDAAQESAVRPSEPQSVPDSPAAPQPETASADPESAVAGPESAAEPVPAAPEAAAEPAAAGPEAADSADAAEPAAAHEERPQKEKKGLFRRLFGR